MVPFREGAEKKDMAEALFLCVIIDGMVRSPEFESTRKKLGEDSAFFEAVKKSIDFIPADGKYLQELARAGWDIEKLNLNSSCRAEWTLV